MLRFAICEDELYFARDLKRMTESYIDKRALEAEIFMFSRGRDFLDSGIKADIVLMDIVLSGENGMDIAENMRDLGSSSQFIFITAYKEYAFRAFDVDAVWYLLKPVDAGKLYVVLDKAVGRAVSGYGKSILITEGEETARIYMKDILYCEVFDHELLIHTITGRYRTFGTLDSFQKKLDGRFFRCHRSYLVNMDYVIDKEDETAYLTGGKKVLIARRRRQEFMHRLLETCQRGAV